MAAERSVATYPSTVTSRRLKSKEICTVLCLSLRATESIIVSFRILTYFIVTTMNSHCMFMSDYPDWGFSMLFSSVVRQMPGYTSQRRGTARTLPNFCVVLCICFVSFCILFVCICVLYYCHWVATQLQLNISCHLFRRVITYCLEASTISAEYSKILRV